MNGKELQNQIAKILSGKHTESLSQKAQIVFDNIGNKLGVGIDKSVIKRIIICSDL